MASLLDDIRTGSLHSSSKRARSHKALLDKCQAQLIGVASSSDDPLSYVIHASTITKGHWLVHHRYSHFAEFHNEFYKQIKKLDHIPDKNVLLSKLKNTSFPRKHFLHQRDNNTVVRDRLRKLDIFLKAVLEIMQLPSMRPVTRRPQHALVRLVKNFLNLESNAKYQEFGPATCSVWEDAKNEFTMKLRAEIYPINEDQAVVIQYIGRPDVGPEKNDDA